MARGFLCLVFVVWVGACAHEQGAVVQSANVVHQELPLSVTLDQMTDGALLLDGLGHHTRKISTRSAEAQAFFDQGFRLTFAFNHDEAARSFAQAAKLDPSCAMCFWGAAYTLGPNYNFPMFPQRAQAAWDAIERARSLAPRSTAVEQALIAALAERYAGPEYLHPEAMQPYAEAYADAMRGVAKRFPRDADVQVLFAEALMNVNPWKLWDADGNPAPGTKEIVATLERVLRRRPKHPGANHYYIHTVEASKNPGKALASANRLGSMMPGAGHLVHMPAHIYQRVGQYEKASEANRAAIQADEQYLSTTQPPGFYEFYLGHNYGFLGYSASMEGRSKEALTAAEGSAMHIPKDAVCGMPGLDFFLSEPMLVMVRFGRWKKLLGTPKPNDAYPILTALWHHARGMALASTRRPELAKKDLAAIGAITATVSEEVLAGLNSGRAILALSAKVLEARIAEQTDLDRAIALWREAAALEDQLAYNEPADWFYPVRPYLGAALLDAKRPKEAEAAFRGDLERHPNNGWALFGLSEALRAQGRTRAANAVQAKFNKAWRRADIELTRAAY